MPRWPDLARQAALKPRSGWLAIDPVGNPVLSTIRYGKAQAQRALAEWLAETYPDVHRRRPSSGWQVVPVMLIAPPEAAEADREAVS